jgi:3-deoxy-manno-octulosonate cytidylyltransferase (CMP-KDO synthetase)
MKVVAVIPARYRSSRFPGKPLADIHGKPMVWWVYQQALKSEALDEICVATEDQRVMDACADLKIPAMLTSDKHRNGTERVAEVSMTIDADVYVTLQGDEPLVDPLNIKLLVDYMLKNSSVDVLTMKVPYHDPVDVINGTTPKVVFDLNNDVLLFSRSPIPYPKAELGYVIWKPIGLYAFRKDTLRLYADLKAGLLESIEDIELLRYVENGIKVRIIEAKYNSIAVDTPKDLERVRILARNNNPKQ